MSQADGFSLESHEWSPAGPGSQSGESGSEHQVLPKSIGRYLIMDVLGRGAFGLVYLAQDTVLQRRVAIKVPHKRFIPSQNELQRYLQEAQLAASLNHPNIIQIYDIGGCAEAPFYIVSCCVAGSSLADLLRSERLPVERSIGLVTALADALAFAHSQGVVHRDIKPGNILLNEAGQPIIADFGLAFRDDTIRPDYDFAGTPAYMSPEQARGEGHRIDGRSDIFSLGVVFYQMLTGRLPFRGDSIESLLEKIRTCEVRPPRQIEPSIPRELERICLRALAHRLVDRYSTACDLAEDLRSFSHSHMPLVEAIQANPRLTKPLPPGHPESTDASSGIVPKGLRAFDEYDSEFFIRLLPGPRDRQGIPDSIRFWKTRIEQLSGNRTFDVGLIYGPSGCGKSSLVRAGLLPTLAPNIHTVYVDASHGRADQRLWSAVERLLTETSSGLQSEPARAHSSLAECLNSIRNGKYLAPGQKLLLVIDQFEQYLNEWDLFAAELVTALRQCDGTHVQCLLMVRDDFWLATSRFMQALEVPVIEDQNAKLVDLFDLGHARKVLTLIGQAFERLPAVEAEFSPGHNEFLEEAVRELAHEGRVVCVRLVMLSEMLKDKPWTVNSLKAIGGFDGAGVAFLENAFDSQYASREFRDSRVAARQILRELLPDSRNEIKGKVRLRETLFDSVRETIPDETFRRLLTLLDTDLRLITPVDGEGQGYQLTHDFLVPAIRAWSEKEQRATLQGRAEIKLAERADFWGKTPEKRHLPSLWEWGQILSLTNSKRWTELESRFMKAARTYHIRSLAVFATASLCLMVTMAFVMKLETQRANNHNFAEAVVARILSEPMARLPENIADSNRRIELTLPVLQEKLNQDSQDSQRTLRLHAALLHSDPAKLASVLQEFLTGAPDNLQPLAEILLPYSEDIRTQIVQAELGSGRNTLNYLAAHSVFNSEDARWQEEFASRAVQALQECDHSERATWLRILRRHQPSILRITRNQIAARQLIPLDLAVSQSPITLDPYQTVDTSTATSIVIAYGEHDRELVLQTLLQAEPKEIGRLAALLRRTLQESIQDLQTVLERDIPLVARGFNSQTSIDIEEYRHQLVLQQLPAALALLHLQHYAPVWKKIADPTDPRLGAALIANLYESRVPVEHALAQLKQQSSPTVIQTLILSLARYPITFMPRETRSEIVDYCIDLYGQSPDSGVRSSAFWALQQWGQAQFINQRPFAPTKSSTERNWLTTPSGLEMAVYKGDRVELVGAEFREWNKQPDTFSWQSRVYIAHDFAIALHELTLREFQKYAATQGQAVPTTDWSMRTLDSPVTSVSYFDAAKYCRWLSEQEGIPEQEQCYPPIAQIGPGMKLPEDYLSRFGYRLPTRAEWEIACRAGTTSPFFFGSRLSPIDNYDWSSRNANGCTHPVAQLMPNRLGLFDMHGNACEWCAGVFTPVLKTKLYECGSDSIGPLEVGSSTEVTLRGGDFPANSDKHTSAHQLTVAPTFSWPGSGLRMVKTLNRPKIECFPIRNWMDRVTYVHTGVDDLQTKNVNGSVHLQRAANSNETTVTANLKMPGPYNYSFELSSISANATSKIEGELFPYEFRIEQLDRPREQDKLNSSSFIHRQAIQTRRCTLSEVPKALLELINESSSPSDYVIEGELLLSGGDYEFQIRSHNKTKLYLDDKLVLDTDELSLLRNTLKRVALSAGKHSLRLQHIVMDPKAELEIAIGPIPASSSF